MVVWTYVYFPDVESNGMFVDFSEGRVDLYFLVVDSVVFLENTESKINS